jgi:hypothetical protein
LEGVAAEAATGAANKAAADIAMSWFSLDMVISVRRLKPARCCE